MTVGKHRVLGQAGPAIQTPHRAQGLTERGHVLRDPQTVFALHADHGESNEILQVLLGNEGKLLSATRRPDHGVRLFGVVRAEDE